MCDVLLLSVRFHGQEVNGGVLNVAEGGRVRFKSGTYMHDVKVSSVNDEGSDTTSDQWFGGCIYNKVRKHSTRWRGLRAIKQDWRVPAAVDIKPRRVLYSFARRFAFVRSCAPQKTTQANRHLRPCAVGADSCCSSPKGKTYAVEHLIKRSREIAVPP